MFPRTAVRGEDERALSRPWPLTLSELRWFEDEGLELTARLTSDDEFAHLEYRRPRVPAFVEAVGAPSLRLCADMTLRNLT